MCVISKLDKGQSDHKISKNYLFLILTLKNLIFFITEEYLNRATEILARDMQRQL